MLVTSSQTSTLRVHAVSMNSTVLVATPSRGAFASWAPETLEMLPCMPAAALSPLAQLTAGLSALTADCGGGTGGGSVGRPVGSSGGSAARQNTAQHDFAQRSATPAGGWTLPDGRLRVGTHLPLLARRYRWGCSHRLHSPCRSWPHNLGLF